MKEKVLFKKLDDRAIVPTYATSSSAGADLYALSDGDIIIESGKTVLVHTGIAMVIPEGFVGLVFARSGLATKRGLAPANKVGVIDSDYRGEIMVPIYNQSDKDAVIESGERIAQIALIPYLTADFEETDVLDETDRGESGFGSTGRK
ncbi:MAG: dUTP diphosphatase [Clostridia bacterium]|nr:dUTP diphosphatase [Clostridia bacterium]